jgi:hypothetical protein
MQLINPFEVKTPEDVSASEVHSLFVDVFTDFYQVKETFHTFLNGPRGSGKSMIFRFMMPDCQMIEKECEMSGLDYFSLYAPIKLTDINYPDLDRLKSNSSVFLNEHLLTSYIATKCFKNLLDYSKGLDIYLEEVKSFYVNTFLWYVDISGEEIKEYDKEFSTTTEYFNQMMRILEKMLMSCKKYCKKIAISPQLNQEYHGPLCNYLDFLRPILLELKKISFMPIDKPIFLLIDDAGYLNKIQTQILNTWVSYRTSHEISLKISTQLDYKSYQTVTSKTIDYPHDYAQVNIATVYTTSNRNYYNRIESIVTKRIKKYLGKEINPKSFFPSDKKQDKQVLEIFNQLKDKHFDNQKSHTASDAARRYATSEYVKLLKSTRSGSTFNYAGFDNLVNISSGIIRYFLEPASRMFSETIAQNEEIKVIDSITPKIQNNVINDFSKKFLEDEFKKVLEEYGDKEGLETLSKADKLYNLINGLGGLFHKIFVSERTERVVFSVALYDLADKELQEIIDLAIHYGYLHQSSIGNKEGTGRSKLYILSRTLAPYFKLDPNGFKGYKFVSSKALKISLYNPKKFILGSTKGISNSVKSDQTSLFDNKNE